jgi:hypothetical protein
MDSTIRFMKSKSAFWKNVQDVPNLSLGHYAYARRQSSMWDHLANLALELFGKAGVVILVEL